MNEKRLKVYLEDHLALIVGEIELAGRCQRSNRATPLGDFLHQLENEVSAQKAIVSDVLHRSEAKKESQAKPSRWVHGFWKRWAA